MRAALPEGYRARELQDKLSQLWLIFRDQYPSSLKGGCVIMGRPVGPTSPPLPTASPERIKFIEKQLDSLGILGSEPHGWIKRDRITREERTHVSGFNLACACAGDALRNGRVDLAGYAMCLISPLGGAQGPGAAEHAGNR